MLVLTKHFGRGNDVDVKLSSTTNTRQAITGTGATTGAGVGVELWPLSRGFGPLGGIEELLACDTFEKDSELNGVKVSIAYMERVNVRTLT